MIRRSDASLVEAWSKSGVTVHVTVHMTVYMTVYVTVYVTVHITLHVILGRGTLILVRGRALE